MASIDEETPLLRGTGLFEGKGSIVSFHDVSCMVYVSRPGPPCLPKDPKEILQNVR